MYDILQLNDMLVPELLDIAEQLKIPNAKKLDKQELVYKILDKQAVLASAVNTNHNDDKGKRKRIVKTCNYVVQGKWLSVGIDNLRHKELTWNKLLYQCSPRLVKFSCQRCS